MDRRAKLAVLIVSYGNPADLERCLTSLARSSWTDFEIFVCENAGEEAFVRLVTFLTNLSGPLKDSEQCGEELDKSGGRLAIVKKVCARGRPISVRLAAATENLGYAGGVNAWLERLMLYPAWEAVLVLNPDTAVSETCLSELMAKAAKGFGMVGGSLVYDDFPNRIINYGLHWSRWTGRTIAVGRNLTAGRPPSHELVSRMTRSAEPACW